MIQVIDVYGENRTKIDYLYSFFACLLGVLGYIDKYLVVVLFLR